MMEFLMALDGKVKFPMDLMARYGKDLNRWGRQGIVFMMEVVYNSHT
jgi:hypothetical protein